MPRSRRRVGRDLLQVVVGVRLELRRRDQPLDEADAQGLLRVHRPRRVEDVLGVGGPDQIHELVHRVEAVDDAEPRGGNAKLGAGRREAEVGRHRERHGAPHAVAVHHRDGGLRAEPDRGVGGLGLLVVVERGGGVLAVLLELGDVRAGREGVGARPAVDDRAHRVVLRQALGHHRDLRPHREADGIAHLGPVEHDGRDRTVLLDQDVVAHVVSPLYCSITPSATRASRSAAS